MWPALVEIFSPEDDDVPGTVEHLSAGFVDRRTGHFSARRLVLLFCPRRYDSSAFKVGYYVSIAGLGRAASDVEFAPRADPVRLPLTGGGAGREDSTCSGGARRTCGGGGDVAWAVSQGSSVRNDRARLRHLDGTAGGTSLHRVGGGREEGGGDDAKTISLAVPAPMPSAPWVRHPGRSPTLPRRGTRRGTFRGSTSSFPGAVTPPCKRRSTRALTSSSCGSRVWDPGDSCRPGGVGSADRGPHPRGKHVHR
mmetsp:Transcript_47573/g.92886  ORF Transcript_47573/g.92886 Transcript_47573/m.92886 type:complete len:252 (+) Transcript_47573:306-1061(+)